MRRVTTLIFTLALGVSFIGSSFLAIHWWNEAHLPMTAERYSALCNDQPECYPEVGYLLGAAFAAWLSLFFILLIVLASIFFAKKKSFWRTLRGAK
jgi:disulfide bond formation protein DsbB